MRTLKKIPVSQIIASLVLAGVSLGAVSAASAADLLDTVKARGSLKIAVEGTYPPFNFKDQKTSELTGFDIEVARLLAAKLG